MGQGLCPRDRLAERGVRLLVCGQTMVGRNLPRDGFLLFVLVSCDDGGAGQTGG